MDITKQYKNSNYLLLREIECKVMSVIIHAVYVMKRSH